MRAVFAICAFCFVVAIYSGYRIVSDTHLPKTTDPSPIPRASNNQHQDSVAAVAPQAVRTSGLAPPEVHAPSPAVTSHRHRPHKERGGIEPRSTRAARR